MTVLKIDCPRIEQQLIQMSEVLHKSPEAVLVDLFAQFAGGDPKFSYDALEKQTTD